MRNNLPVTQREYDFPSDQTLLSTTDPSSHITYANDAFIRTSGYEPDQLAGEPHNLVRHPDMPEEAFADMWHDLKDGRPWTGLVKNRCKNGDYYWVLATATPMRENGQVVGYMSVRRKPTRQQVDAAESAYRLFRERKAGGLRILHGAVVKGGDGFFGNLALKSKLMAGFGALLVALVLIAGVGLWG